MLILLCSARRSLCTFRCQGPNGRLWSFRVKTKRRIEEKLRKYLETNRPCDETIYFSGVTDNYASSPSIARLFWRTLLAAPVCSRPRRIAIQTRFRPDRDVEDIAEYNRQTTTSDGAPPVVVNYSLGTDDNEIIRKFERATPSFEKRLARIKKLRAHDVFVSATLSPFAFKDARETLHRLHDLGVSFVSVLFFKIRTNSADTPPLFIKYLKSNHPHLLDLSWQADRLDEMREIYGESRVLEGQTGFSALTIPHLVGTCPPDQLGEVAMQMKNE